MPLTRKQKWRIDKVQSEKIARADKAALKVESQLQDNLEYPGIVITRFGQRQLIEAENGELFQSVSRQNIGFSVAGDRVLFQKTKHDEAIVTAIYPRDTELKRQDKLIAANIDQLWLVVATEPHYEYELIDRYLIMAENSQLPIGIIVNKIELVDNQNKTISDFSHYASLGYDVHFLSVIKQTNLDQLISAITYKIFGNLIEVKLLTSPKHLDTLHKFSTIKNVVNKEDQLEVEVSIRNYYLNNLVKKEVVKILS